MPNDHYVAQTYLKQFADERGLLHPYRKSFRHFRSSWQFDGWSTSFRPFGHNSSERAVSDLASPVNHSPANPIRIRAAFPDYFSNRLPKRNHSNRAAPAPFLTPLCS